MTDNQKPTQPTASTHPIPLGYAIAYARLGWPVFPLHSVTADGRCTCGKDCGNPGKHPRTKHGFKQATTDIEQIRAWWRSWPDANIGIVTGTQSNLLVIDIDPRSGGDRTWGDLRRNNTADSALTPSCKTGGGGSHVYYLRPADIGPVKSRAHSLGQGIDVKCDGGYVVAPPSRHESGDCYEWRPFASPLESDVQPAPDWIVSRLTTPTTHAKRAATVTDSWLTTAFSAAGWLGDKLDNGGYRVRCPWDEDHTTGKPGDTSTVILPATAEHPSPRFHCSHGHCTTRTIADVRGALPAAAVAAADRAHPPIATPVGEDDDWQQNFQRTKDGGLTNSIVNLITVLTHDPRWRGVLRYNEFTERIEFATAPPWHPDDAPLVVSTYWTDADATRLCAWFERFVSIHRVGIEAATQAVIVAAHRTPIHPVRDWLRSLKWDGIIRLPTWLSTYMGCDQTDYTRAIGLRFMIQMVARVMQPGCRADHVLILEGEQGVKKSTALAVLVGDEWFADDLAAFDNKDSADGLRGKWLIELSELSSHMRRAKDKDTYKAFISRRIDHYRPAYGRNTIDRPRHCCFSATTNDFQYLIDESGARRNWAVRITRTIDVDALAKDRALLFAEAVANYDSGEQWWLTRDEIPKQIEEQQERMTEDPWFALVADWVEDQTGPITTERILSNCISKPPEHRDSIDTKRVGAIMRMLGYSRVRRRVDGTRSFTFERQRSLPE